MDEGSTKSGVEKVIKEIGVKVKIENVIQIRTEKEEWGEMVIVKLGSEKKKRVMEGKKKLKGEKYGK